MVDLKLTPMYTDSKGLAELARRAIGGRTQAQVASELGVTRASVNKALNYSEVMRKSDKQPQQGSRMDGLRITIIERYMRVRVEPGFYRLDVSHVRLDV